MELLNKTINYQDFLEFYYNEFKNGNNPENIDDIVLLSDLKTDLIEIKERIEQIKSDSIYSSLTLPLIPVLGTFLYNSNLNKSITIISCFILTSYILKDIYDAKKELYTLKLNQTNLENKVKKISNI